MKSFFTKLVCTFFLIFSAITIYAQTKFIVTATPTQAAKNEYITLKLTIENGNNINKIDAPSLNDFNIVSGPNQETSISTVNGVSSQSISLSYILQAKKPGNFIIGTGTAVVAGKSYKSAPLKISISNKEVDNSQQNSPMGRMQSPFSDIFDEPKQQDQFEDYILRKGETVAEKVSKNMQLRLQTSKSTCFVGEPILATYKLYTRLQSETSLDKNPSFSGFSVVDMMDRNELDVHTQEKLNGRMYNVYNIRKAQLYPLQAGAIELEVATLNNKVSFVKYDDGAGINKNIITENVTLSSKQATINVLPLPENNKPENFTGAVGDFSIDAQLEKTNFSTDETGKLIITIIGNGNMQLLTIPQIGWPSTFEVFEPKTIDNTNQSTIPISGSKTFEIPFTISNAGKYSVPSVNFSFFNPNNKTYKTISTKEIKFFITKGSGIAKKNLSLKKVTNQESLLDKLLSKRIVFSILLLIGMIVSFIFMRKKNKKMLLESLVIEKEIPEISILKEEKTTKLETNKNHLEKTTACFSNDICKEFYTILNKELREFISTKYSLDKNAINTNTLSAILDKHHVDNNLVLRTQQLLKNIEWQLYTPFERDEKMKEIYGTALEIIHAHLTQKTSL